MPVWGYSTEIPGDYKWMDSLPPRLAYTTGRLDANQELVVTDGTRVIARKSLEEGYWNFLSDYSPDTLTMTRDLGGWNDHEAEVVLCPLDREIERLPINPPPDSMGSYAIRGTPVWSPDRKYVLINHRLEKEDSEPRNVLAVVNVETYSIVMFEEIGYSTMGKWTGENQFECIASEQIDDGTKDAIVETIVKRLRLEVRNGASELISEHSIPASMYEAILQPGEFVLLCDSDGGANVEKGKAVALLELSSGKRTDLPNSAPNQPSSSDRLSFDWSHQSKRIVYLAGEGAAREIVVASPDGVVDKIGLEDNEEVGGFHISSDGMKVLFSNVRPKEFQIFGMTHLAIWDLSDGTANTIKKLGIWSSLMSDLGFSGSGMASSSAKWAPDSRSVAIPNLGWTSDLDILTAYEVAEYAEWVETANK